MSKWAKYGEPCPCGKSSDAYAIDKQGGGYCFSCNKPFGSTNISESNEGVSFEFLERRGIAKETHEFFNVKTKVAADGRPLEVGYPFPNGAVQVRRDGDVPKKDKYRSVGPMSEAGGWGPQYFPAGSAKAITITEGLDDAMAAWQMLGKYPVYAVKSASTAVSDVRRDFEYLNSFERIYLALDADEHGENATKSIAACFDFKKVYHVKLAPLKDAQEYREAGRDKEFRNVWHNAQRYMPDGVYSSFEALDAVLDSSASKPGHPWPWDKIQYLTDGIKPKAYLVSGLEGIGKTEVFHALEHYLAKSDPEANIGILHFEEPLDENIKRMVGYELKTPCHFSDSVVSLDEIKKTFRNIAGRPDRIHFYRHYGSDDPDSILSLIRFLVAACGCKYVFLDNITVILTGRTDDDERRALDYFSTRLEMLVKELEFTLFTIAHENDFEQIRGSRNISKVFDVWLNLKRNLKENSHVIYTTLFKNRGGRGSGPVDELVFDEATHVLSAKTEELPS